MKTFSYTIKDEIGIHARPAGILSKLAKQFSSEITVAKGEQSTDARKLMMLMGMGIKCGDTVTVSISGEDEAVAFEKMKEFFEKNL